MKKVIGNLYTRKGGSAEERVSELKRILGLGTAADITSTKDIVDITYAALVALLQSSEEGAVPGQYYRITDYRTVHYMTDIIPSSVYYMPSIIEGAINTGDLEPLIVLATSESNLSPFAYSELYPNDIIHYDWNPDNWLTDISFGSDDETLVPGFKGVIYFRHDTINDNYMGYDFRKVKFRRWNNGSVVGDVWKSKYQISYSKMSGAILDDFIDVLTFNCPGGEEQYNNEVRGVHIESYKDDIVNLYYTGSILSNNVFHLEADFGWYQVLHISMNTFSAYNTFNGYIDTNSIGHKCVANIIGNNFFNNTIGDHFASNRIGKEFKDNTIFSSVVSNIFGDGCMSNVIGNECCNGNVFGDNFKRNKVGDGFGYGHVAPWSRPNTIGNNVHDCTFGSSMYYSTIGDDCHGITIGNGCQHIDIGDNCYNIEIGNGSGYIEIANDSSATKGSHDIKIGTGCGYDWEETPSSIIIGDNNYDIVLGSECQDIVLGDNCNYNVFGDGVYTITLGELCTNNIFGNCCYEFTLPAKSIQNEFKPNIFGVDFTESDVVLIENKYANIVHQFGNSGTGVVFQTYIDETDSVPEIVITTKTIGVYS